MTLSQVSLVLDDLESFEGVLVRFFVERPSAGVCLFLLVSCG